MPRAYTLCFFVLAASAAAVAVSAESPADVVPESFLTQNELAPLEDDEFVSVSPFVTKKLVLQGALHDDDDDDDNEDNAGAQEGCGSNRRGWAMRCNSWADRGYCSTRHPYARYMKKFCIGSCPKLCNVKFGPRRSRYRRRGHRRYRRYRRRYRRYRRRHRRSTRRHRRLSCRYCRYRRFRNNRRFRGFCRRCRAKSSGGSSRRYSRRRSGGASNKAKRGGRTGQPKVKPPSKGTLAARWVKAHNMYRCMHNAPKVTWSKAMAASAQEWANRGVFSHSQSYKIAPPAGPAGENLAYGQQDLERATHDWYNEVKDCGSFPGCKRGASGVVGHFTAMIWAGVKEIGCAQGKMNSNGRPLYVCRYKSGDTLSRSTPNMAGGYEANVFKKVKSKVQCGGPKPVKMVNNMKGCIPKKSVGKCGKCFNKEQCAGSMYCCPYMKMCVGRGTRCGYPDPPAICQPMCYDSMSQASCKCKSKDFPSNWQKETCK